MTLSARFSLLHSDLNDFLFAPVGDQQNGMPLNVISALIRLDVDPWKRGEAACSSASDGRGRVIGPNDRPLDLSRPDPSEFGDEQPVGGAVAKAEARCSSKRSADLTKRQAVLSAVMFLACLAFGAAVLTVIF